MIAAPVPEPPHVRYRRGAKEESTAKMIAVPIDFGRPEFNALTAAKVRLPGNRIIYIDDAVGGVHGFSRKTITEVAALLGKQFPGGISQPLPGHAARMAAEWLVGRIEGAEILQHNAAEPIDDDSVEGRVYS